MPQTAAAYAPILNFPKSVAPVSTTSVLLTICVSVDEVSFRLTDVALILPLILPS